MNLVIRGNPDGSWLDLNQLMERLDYTPTKQALQFSIRSLIRSQFLAKRDREFRRGALRRVLAPTAKAYSTASQMQEL
jgi:hypothetical protein